MYFQEEPDQQNFDKDNSALIIIKEKEIGKERCIDATKYNSDEKSMNYFSFTHQEIDTLFNIIILMITYTAYLIMITYT